MDFGGLKMFKEWSEYMFDHTLVIAHDDPERETFEQLNAITGGYNDQGIVDLRIVEGVGCEMFAKMCYDKMAELLEEMKQNKHSRYPVNGSVRLVSAEVFEHDANSAIYEG
jgi:6-pyruvoyltetrahydropterin/6-carboxytetrahydropterin synthase